MKILTFAVSLINIVSCRQKQRHKAMCECISVNVKGKAPLPHCECPRHFKAALWNIQSYMLLHHKPMSS